MTTGAYVIDAADGVQMLIGQLATAGYRVVGPTVRDGAIVHDEIDSADQLPAGWGDQQDNGHYRLTKRGDGGYFGYAVGPHSCKQFLHVSQQELWEVDWRDGELTITPAATTSPKYAFLGMRACDIHAVDIQDRVLVGGTHVDPHYAARRQDNFVVAVNCGQAGGTCFCVSMNTGPKATHGFDLALTELIDEARHHFLVEVGSERGGAILAEIPSRPATNEEVALAEAVVAATAGQMGRDMNAETVRDLLMDNLEHPRWDDVADRCLSCGNCTLVCPTCFCTKETDGSDLSGDHATRTRQWDSCFTLDFSYVHGGSVRRSTKSRYRQWMTHKLATWIDQFGSSGCVGCGRCITWCPVGIDITEEVRAIAENGGGR